MRKIIFRVSYLLKEKIIQIFQRFRHFRYNSELFERNLRDLFSFKNYYRNLDYFLTSSDLDVIPRKREIPKSAGIGITNVCNLNCIMCNIKLAKIPSGYMDTEVFKLVLKDLKKIGISSVALHTIGEPLLHPRLGNLFHIIKKSKFKVKFSTNGQFPERLKNLLYSHSKEIDFIRFSIDGAKPKTYEFIRKGAKFEKLIRSLEIVHNFNQKKINYNIEVRIDSILSLTNINEIPLYFKTYGKYCRPESINFNIVNGLSPDIRYFKEAFPFPNLIKREVPCSLPFHAIYFTNEGKLTLCCEDFNEELIVGNIKDHSITEIWNNNYSNGIRRQHLNQETIKISVCKNCYGPYRIISKITNYYIHFLYYYHPNYSDHVFGKKIFNILKEMDEIMKKKDIPLLKKKLIYKFKEITT